MSVEILTIGTELVTGLIVDGNAAHIARVLSENGFEVARTGSVADDRARMKDAMRGALERSGTLVCSGGLGPTADDFTRDVAAEVFGRKLVRDQALVDGLRERFARRGITPMPETNLVQADVPEGATVIPNALGSAPGLWIEDGARLIVLMPGVPKEMQRMLAEEIIPRLQARAGTPPHGRSVIRSRILRTTGIGESALADKVGKLNGVLSDKLTLAWLPTLSGSDLRLTAWNMPESEADAALAKAADAIRPKLGHWYYGEGDEDLAEKVLALLEKERARISVAESCTGGLLGQRLTAIPGCSSWFFGGVIAYDNNVKLDFLGVSSETLATFGAVSEEVAREMAEGAARAMRTEAAIAITGIAGPDGGSESKPVGTVWIGIRWRDTTRAFHHVFPGDRDDVRGRAAQWSLDYLRRMITGAI
jgi:nicotinamide-nucleotide amidase